jgi:hypothetical protein
VKSARPRIEGEAVAAVVGRLVVLVSNGMAAQMALQQRPGSAVRDDGDVALAARRRW